MQGRPAPSATLESAGRHGVTLAQASEAAVRRLRRPDATDTEDDHPVTMLARLSAALAAHDPQRTLERGYALAVDADGEPLATADAIRTANDFDLRMADGTGPARIRDADAAQPTLVQDSEPDEH